MFISFRNGMSNCIVATDVIDEGVDIPSCTLIVRYYAPMDFRAYIQSKGRARHSTSHFIILASINDDYITRYKSFQEIEKYLKKVLIKKLIVIFKTVIRNFILVGIVW